MVAKMNGRVSGVRYDFATGALIEVRVDTANGNITVYKPDSWSAWGAAGKSLLGEQVQVTVEWTVNP